MLSFCLRANGLLPPGTGVTIRNLKGLAAVNAGPVAVKSGMLSPLGTVNVSAESLRVNINSATYSLSFSVTITGSVSAAAAAAEAAPDGLNLALYGNVTIMTTRMQVMSSGCSLAEGDGDTLMDIGGRVGMRRLLRWTPTREQAGRTYSVCMSLVPRTGPPSAVRCFSIKVRGWDGSSRAFEHRLHVGARLAGINE